MSERKPERKRHSAEVRSTSSVVVENLRQQILEGILHGGERVMQDAVATSLGVSQTVVREAFKQLTAEGFLRSEARRGVTVARLTRDEASELIQLRSVLEPQALEASVPKLTDENIEDARDALARLERATSPQEVIRLNALFHDTLYGASKRERTLALVAMLRLSFDRYFHFACDESGQVPRTQQEHRGLLKLCEAGDVEAACNLLRRHILGTGEVICKRLKASEHG